MVPDSDLEDGQLRLLEVDNRVVIPTDTHVRFVVTGADVIHDFRVPSLGLKIDATPGRNQINAPFMHYQTIIITECASIMCRLNTTDSLGNTNIPWVETKNIAARRIVLKSMLESLPLGSPIRKYLINRAGWLLKPLSGDTGIPVNGNKTPHIEGNLTSVTRKSIKSIRNDINNKSGCYIFIERITGLFYIGSAINVHTRLKYHFNVSLNKANGSLYKIAVPTNWSNFSWVMVANTTNYLFE
jgi:hypothetical protein